ncbi:hypothetical protein ACFO0A_06145 [Novosphingobium tardum]|uniref:BA14K family protein n=1 Tax=Novosphingobium tardum TaxID=1538021 RepID=A0ABV8RNF2_9SPHN
MTTIFQKTALAAALLAAGTMAASPAEARDRYYRHRGGDDAAIAIGAGLVGLAIGAAISSHGDRYDRGYYYDQSYYPRYRGSYYSSYPSYNYYNSYPAYNYSYPYRGYEGYRTYDNYRYRDRRWRHRGY